jgi:hypothetical protein
VSALHRSTLRVPRSGHTDEQEVALVSETDPVESGILGAAAEHLSRKYAGDDGEFSEDEVRDAVREAAAELSDAPVQTFVPLIAENKARGALQEEAERREEHLAE